MIAVVFAVGTVLCAAPVTSGCCGDLGGQLKEGMEKSFACSSDIKKEIGVDAQVNFNISNGKKIIQVELASTPPGDALATKAKVETIVRRHFPDADTIEVKM